MSARTNPCTDQVYWRPLEFRISSLELISPASVVYADFSQHAGCAALIIQLWRGKDPGLTKSRVVYLGRFTFHAIESGQGD